MVAIVDTARDTACEKQWRGQSERLQKMALARHSSGSDKLEMVVNIWSLSVQGEIVACNAISEVCGVERVKADRLLNSCG